MTKPTAARLMRHRFEAHLRALKFIPPGVFAEWAKQQLAAKLTAAERAALVEMGRERGVKLEVRP